LHEWKGIINGYFDNTGLINNPLNDGESSNKKAYYTFRFLADKLDTAAVGFGSDFMSYMETSVFQGCEFILNGGPCYSLWIDDPALAPKPVSYPTEYQAFKVSQLVPGENNDIFFEIVTAVNGRFEYPVDLNPVLIEPVPCPNDGDINSDGQLTPADSLLAFEYYLGLGELTHCQQQRADVSGDMAVTPADALSIFECYMGLDCSLISSL